MAINSTTIGGIEVFGVEIDAETRCRHYRTEIDRIAIRFACCGQYYACFECHQELVDHDAEVWPESEGDVKAILCGTCGAELTINEYKDGDSRCPECKALFNPGCKAHWHLYFAD